jgi:hypothetical protein
MKNQNKKTKIDIANASSKTAQNICTFVAALGGTLYQPKTIPDRMTRVCFGCYTVHSYNTYTRHVGFGTQPELHRWLVRLVSQSLSS